MRHVDEGCHIPVGLSYHKREMSGLNDYMLRLTWNRYNVIIVLKPGWSTQIEWFKQIDWNARSEHWRHFNDN